MFESIHYQYPTYFILFCLLLGIVYGASLYLRDKAWRENASYLPLALGILRTLAIGSIAYFLLVPIIERYKQRTQNAIIVVAQDTSESIADGTDPATLQTFNDNLTELQKSLGESYTVENFYFGESISVTKSDSTQGKSTDISKAFEYIQNQYADQHIGAIIMATDGIYNEGRNPLYLPEAMPAPLYAIALGDTTIRKDILIQNLLYNKIAYLGDKFEIQVDIKATNAPGTKSELSIYKITSSGQTLLDKTLVNIQNNDHFSTHIFNIPADSPGAIQYLVQISGVPNEVSTTNNRKTAYIDVIDARKEIFIVANAPHPDLQALKTALEINKNYKISQYYAKDNIPIEKADITVFHNLPSKENQITNLLSQLDKRKKPRVYILGSQVDLLSLTTNNVGLKIAGVMGQTNESQATMSNSFNAFVLSDKVKKLVGSYPPLLTPFGDYTLPATAETLLTQKINGIQTNYPLVAFDNSQGIRRVFICGEGLWKWRLFNYLQDKNHEAFDELMKKTLQYASVVDDKRKFKVNIAKTDYKVNEDILLDAQLYNDVYEMVNNPDASLTIANDNGQSYDFTFSKSNNYYVLNAGALAEGNYTYTGSTNYNGTNLSSTGKFRIEAIQKESYNLTANHGLLYQLAEANKGKVFYPSNLLGISDELKDNTSMKAMIYQEKDNRMLMHFKWLLIPILLLLCIEWFVRRYRGSY